MITFTILFLLPTIEAQLPNPRKYKPSSNSLRRNTQLNSASSRFWKLYRYELTGGVGMTQFFGDVGGYSNTDNFAGLKDFSFLQTRFDISAGMKYRVRSNLNARINLNFGYFHSTDMHGSNETRAIEATTMFFEPDLIGEFYFIKHKSERSYLIMKGRRRVSRPILPLLDFYVFTGIGGISYNVNFTEPPVSGSTKTKGFAPVIPGGIGMNLIFSKELNFGLELGGRYSFSDYLDGYTSEFSKSNDVYYLFNFTITYKMKTNRKGWPVF
jgi:hypothetical protein